MPITVLEFGVGIRGRTKWLPVALVAVMAACSANGTAVSPEAAVVNQDGEYHVGVGDLLRITVFGQEALSGEFEVDSTGRISLPLVGDLLVIGLTEKEAEDSIEAVLSPEYLENAVVIVEVLDHQFAFLIGEDGKPVPHQYRKGMRVIDLIDPIGWASGFTYRTSGEEFVITRDGEQTPAGLQTLVMPGDVIELKERYF